MLLQLLPGPVLQATRSSDADTDDDVDTDVSIITDVTADAVAYLYQHVEVASGVRLSDWLGLLDACPALMDVYRLNYAQAFAEEARLGPLVTDADKRDDRYLEGRRSWDYDTCTRHYSGVDALLLCSVAPIEDDYQCMPPPDLPRGLQRYGVSMTPVRNLLHLPVRLNTQIGLWDSSRTQRKAKPRAMYCQEFLLGDVLRAILYELSWFGPPGEGEAMSEHFAKLHNDPSKWTVFDDTQALFDHLASLKLRAKNPA